MSRVWSVIPGSFHLLHIMLDEYVYLVMETQRDQSHDLHLQRLVQRHMKNAGVDLCAFTFCRLVEKNPRSDRCIYGEPHFPKVLPAAGRRLSH